MEDVLKKRDQGDCPIGIRHEAEILVLKDNILVLTKDVREIRDKLLGRPSWSITIAISILSTIAFSSLTFAFTVMRDVALK